jgi:hypothetical protein
VIPHITRGGDTRGVIRYLLGKGRREEHRDPHLVAGSPEATRQAAGRQLEMRDAGPLARFLDEPREAFGTRVTIAERNQDGQVVGQRDAHVWHCSLSLHPDEPALSDERWGQLAGRFVAELGFAGEDAGSQCRWLAVRHGLSTGGSDHIHLVVGLVAEDGSKAGVHNDRPRAQAACRQLEREFGLRELEARSRGAGERCIEPGEMESDRRRGRPVGDRGDGGGERPEAGSRRTLERIVRACATAASDEADFVGRLRGEGVLWRARFGEGGRSEVVGYSVALPARDGERPVWFGGGRLSRELTLPRLRGTWPALAVEAQAAVWAARTAGPSRGTDSLASAELQARCVAELAKLRERLRLVPADDRGTWAHLARDAAGVLAAWSLRTEVEPGPLAEASRSLARSAQLRRQDVRRRRWQSIAPTRNTAALLLGVAAGSVSNAALMGQMVELALALRDMHAAAGDADRAAQLEQTARHELEALAGRVQAGGAERSQETPGLAPGAALDQPAPRRRGGAGQDPGVER